MSAATQSTGTPQETPSRRVRVVRALARGLLALPPAALVRLSGRPAVRIDGLTLDPSIQFALTLMGRREEQPLETLGVEGARRRRRSAAGAFGPFGARIGAVRDLVIDTPVPLRARSYEPAGGGDGGLIVFLHGGGFVFGDLETHDGLCRLFCERTAAAVLAIDYRLAPEHPFPAAVEDAHAALRWARSEAGALGADERRIAIMGDSAGGNLAAVACQLARDAGEPQPAAQVLIYPVTDFSLHRRSRELFGEGFFLTASSMDWFDELYLGGAQERKSDPRASPLLADSLAGLAPAIVTTAGFDPLRDEGELYAQALREAGVRVLQRRCEGMIHGFASMAGVSSAAHDAVLELAGATRALLAVAA
jgi:acetyl esterase